MAVTASITPSAYTLFARYADALGKAGGEPDHERADDLRRAIALTPARSRPDQTAHRFMAKQAAQELVVALLALDRIVEPGLATLARDLLALLDRINGDDGDDEGQGRPAYLAMLDHIEARRARA